MNHVINHLLRHELINDAERILYITGDPRHATLLATEVSAHATALDVDYTERQLSAREREIDDLNGEIDDLHDGIRAVLTCLEDQVDDDRESLTKRLRALL